LVSYLIDFYSHLIAALDGLLGCLARSVRGRSNSREVIDNLHHNSPSPEAGMIGPVLTTFLLSAPRSTVPRLTYLVLEAYLAFLPRVFQFLAACACVISADMRQMAEGISLVFEVANHVLVLGICSERLHGASI
jgi:hypothetical protein